MSAALVDEPIDAVLVTCPTCRGVGEVPINPAARYDHLVFTPCEDCDGEGEVRDTGEPFAVCAVSGEELRADEAVWCHATYAGDIVSVEVHQQECWDVEYAHCERLS